VGDEEQTAAAELPTAPAWHGSGSARVVAWPNSPRATGWPTEPLFIPTSSTPHTQSLC